MSLLASISAKRCALCRGPVGTAFVDTGKIVCLDCFLHADFTEIEAPPFTPQTFKWKTPAAKKHVKREPTVLYCHRRCQRFMEVEENDMRGGWCCTGCGRLLLSWVGRDPMPMPDEDAPCTSVLHIGIVDDENAMHCLHCSGTLSTEQEMLT